MLTTNSSEADHEAVDSLINVGADIAGGVTGAALGFFAAGPVGAIAGGATSPVVAQTFRLLAREIKQRILGPREEVRIGATLTYAIAKIVQRLEQGQSIRDDDFFTNNFKERSDSAEIIEGILLAAQREHQEKKLLHYGSLLASIAFRSDIDRGTANTLISIAEKLSYRQLCVLSLDIRQDEFLGSQSLYYVYAGPETAQLLSLHSDILSLSQLNLIQLIDFHTESHPVFGSFTTHSLGRLVFDLMELSELKYDDIQENHLALQYWNPDVSKIEIE
jgi:hypothetical protein